PIIEDQLSELQINFVVTDTVFINIEQKKAKYMTVAVDSLQIDLATNHRITSPIAVVPDTTQVTGPKSYIDTLQKTYQLTPDVGDISKRFNRDIPISLPNNRLMKSIPDEVRIAFDVQRFERLS